MTHLLENLLTASFHGSIVILAVIVLRFVLRKTPKKYICLLWLLAGVRLLLPVQISSSLSLQPRIAIPGNLLAAYGWLSWLWIGVAIGFAVYSLIAYRNLKKKVREAVRIRGGWECDRIETAFILGFIKPKIYIPMGMSTQNRKHILEHERTHLDKGDHWIKMIGFLALALHWFNPLVWIAYLLLSRDIEMACDERVVQFMEPEDRKAYSAALLSCSAKKMHFAASPVAFGEVNVKHRILSILNYRKPGFWMGLCGVLAIAFVTLCLMTSPGGDAAPVLTAEQQAQLERITQCREDLEEALERKEFHYSIDGTDEFGAFVYSTELYRYGEDTLWTHQTRGWENPDNGRLTADGICYALVDNNWVKTDGPDREFTALLSDFLWDDADVVFLGQVEEDGRIQIRFTARQVDEDDRNVTITCFYLLDGILEGVRIADEDPELKAFRNLNLIPNSVLYDGTHTGGNYIAQAKRKIIEGYVSAEDLDQRLALQDWGVHFRVDDDLLTGKGANVYIGQSELGNGVLTTTEKYWLDRYEDNTWVALPTVNEPQWSADIIGIPTGSSVYGYVDWSTIYGELEPGRYRMGKTVQRCGKEDSSSKVYTFHSEFTIYETVNSDSPEAGAAVERCYAAVEKLINRGYVHYRTNEGHAEEGWFHGQNYLQITDFDDTSHQTPENKGRVDITVRWEGIGYSQVREDPEVWGSKVIGMKVHTLSPDGPVWENDFSDVVWSYMRNNKTASFPEGIGIISDEIVRFALNWKNSETGPEYQVILTYTFDGNGELTYLEYNWPQFMTNGEDYITYVEILDTSIEEIDAVIESYTENPVVADFSWQEAQAKYTNEEFNIREDSFVNKGGSPISNSVDAARLALKEYPNLGEYLSLDVCRDEEAGIWKVTIQSYVDYQATYAFRDVYLTDDGETKLLVYEGPIWYNEPRK
ncbi:MAG: hypothetical protein IJA75_08960 [Oscillospiraceae bacterium]|nr:hypothetical protein [Oscillospiraceae bacterium]